MEIIQYQKKYKRSLEDLWRLVFGKSSVDSEYLISWLTEERAGMLLIAVNKSGTVVGSRGSWYWEFDNQKRDLKASQFGLTAVHPEYRRRGIFSKLNRRCLQILENEGVDFVFNISLPNAMLGYEKMGWEYNFSFLRLMRFNVIPFSRPTDFRIHRKMDDRLLSVLGSMFSRAKGDIANLTSVHDIKTLQARFKGKNNYNVYETEDIIIIYKKIKEKLFSSILIGEMFFRTPGFEALKKHLNAIQVFEKSFFISTYASINHPLVNLYQRNMFKMLPKKSPLGIKLINRELDIRDLHENLIISYIDVDTF